jgi:hypothetical protein
MLPSKPTDYEFPPEHPVGYTKMRIRYQLARSIAGALFGKGLPPVVVYRNAAL